MKSIVKKYGIGVGVFISLAMMISHFLAGDPPDFDMMEVVGWTSMILASLTIFIALRAVREGQGGFISFKDAFLKGLMVAVIAGGIVGLYTVLHIGLLDRDYTERYMEYEIAKMAEGGMTPAEIETELEKTAELRDLLENPFAQGLVMMIMVFLVGLLVSLGSGAILARKEGAEPSVVG